MSCIYRFQTGLFLLWCHWTLRITRKTKLFTLTRTNMREFWSGGKYVPGWKRQGKYRLVGEQVWVILSIKIYFLKDLYNDLEGAFAGVATPPTLVRTFYWLVGEQVWVVLSIKITFLKNLYNDLAGAFAGVATPPNLVGTFYQNKSFSTLFSTGTIPITLPDHIVVPRQASSTNFYLFVHLHKHSLHT